MGVQKRIYVVNGKPRSGKDSFEQFVGLYKPSVKFSAITYVKTIATWCGYREDVKNPKDREFLHKLKMLLSWYSDVPMRSVFETIDAFLKGYTYLAECEVLFIDAREVDDIRRIKTAYPQVETVYIHRPSSESMTYGNDADDNASQDGLKYDYIINNAGDMVDFHKNIAAWMGEVGMVPFNNRGPYLPQPEFSLREW